MVGGLNLSVELQDQLSAGLKGLEGAALNMTPAWAGIANYLVEEAEERFRTETDPAGVPWKPSRRVLDEGGQTLSLSGDLRRSIKPDWGSDFASAGPEASGGAAEYAEIHQRGGIIRARPGVARSKAGHDGSTHFTARALNTPFGPRQSVTIPARPYMGLSAEGVDEVLFIIAEHHQRAAGGGEIVR
ncbi:phage virion morphogenesis protein [Sphingomonas sp. SRS2]|uniref:phage virion morphogenesis protein n=1 Tax=Sphingomonas sp. SRS2 TaxID=133190 RepID=UPI0006184C06|nr:phage virion morphogenesis protein [Sphingomonas sp. SRS2]KKC27439.1 hypothetical protein WP12_03425 [Sphingomonas sp. SRS2]